MSTKTMMSVTLCLSLMVFFTTQAEAACASKPVKAQFGASSLFPVSKAVTAAQAPVTAPMVWDAKESEDSDAAGSNDSIVGLWAITYLVGNTSAVWDQGFEQWHSDGLELNNDNAVPPSVGNICVGVYKQIGNRTFKLRHMTWNFDATGTLTGTFLLLQTVTVAKNGKTFNGTYVSDSFDLDGNVIPALHAEGVLSATRITVD